MFDFRAPLFLILLAAIPFLIFAQRRTKVIAAKWRKGITFFLRGTALLCAILALADLHRTHQEQRLAVVFLIDTSESIPRTQHEEAFKQINAAVAKLKPTDRFGIISFATEASVLLELRPKQAQPSVGAISESRPPLLRSLESAPTVSLETLAEQAVGREGTDVLTALTRAIALLPDGYHRRIVLFSDGIHNAGGTSVKAYLPLLSSSNVEILTIPLDPVNDAVRVAQLQLPTQVRKGQRFKINAVIETDGSIPTLTATLYRDEVLMGEAEWTLQSGRHVLPLPAQQVSEERSHTYQLNLNVTDAIRENNQGYGVVKVQDKPRALYLTENAVTAQRRVSTTFTPLKTILEENGFVVAVMSPAELPTELVELQRNDVLILSNISADAFSTEQLQRVENYVRDLGRGLVVIGGDRAFGAGGYTATALERALPVEMTPRERKDSVALVFVIDTSGSMANYVGTRQKIQLAIEGIRAGIHNLDEEDLAGILGFNVAVHVISELTADHGALLQNVARLKPTGGTTSMAAAIQRAHEILKLTDAKRKHILLLSDGKSDDKESQLLNLAKRIADTRIGITTIAIGDANKRLLDEFADAGGGHSVYVQNVQELPSVLMHTVRETRNYIVQEEFQPIITAPGASILAGIRSPPLLYGYVATAEKAIAQVFIRSHQDEPILAGWHYGLGKSVAWTSDVKPAWAKEWIPWGNFGKFWGQVVNWTLPAGDASDFDLSVLPRNGVAEVIIDAQHSAQAGYTLHVAGPNAASERVEMQQVTPTRYSGTFQLHDSGAYIATAQRKDDASSQTEILSISYPAEYAEFSVNTTLLKKLAADTGGVHEPTPVQIAASAGAPIEKRVSLAQALLVAAAIMFVLELILRRFSIASGYLAELRAQLRRDSETVAPETLTRLTRKKADVGTISNSDVCATGANAPQRKSVVGKTVPEAAAPQPTEGTMTRLLAAKRKARSTS